MEPRLILPDLPDWADLRLARPPDGTVVVAALVAGAMADVAVRSGGALAAAVMVAAVCRNASRGG
ncbi:MAG: hypothetical protein ACRD0O_16285, partial [Acidimicrobiia bacterium]